MMNYKEAAAILLLLLFIANPGVQGSRTSGRLTSGNNAGGALVSSMRIAETQMPVIAIVNGQELTLRDLDPKARQVVESLGAKLAQTRREVLDAQINSVLLELEAARREVTVDQLYNTDIASQVTAPTEEQIKTEYTAHPELYGEYEFWLVHDGIAGKLRDAQEKGLWQDWISQRYRIVRVAKNVDINDPKLRFQTILATVGGRKVTLGSLSERLKPRIYKLRQDMYEIEKDAVDRAINDLLVKAEAKRKSLSPDDVVRAEITDKLHHPTEEEIAKYYEQNQWQFKDLSSARAKIADRLVNQKRAQLEKSLYDRLRAGATLRMLITEPKPPVQTISTGQSPFRGDAHSPVTVVEFGDFQCYACGQMHPIVEQVLKPYGQRVRFVFRQYPLSMHTHARKAAEAALAAHAQGKFWEYAALLFNNQKALDPQSLKKYATEVGLDGRRFNKALDDGLYAEEVRRDMRESEIYGVDIVGTPTYFINGVRLPLSAYSAEGLRKAIEDALVTSNQSQKRAFQ